MTKYEKMKQGAKDPLQNPWIDPEGYRGVIAAFEQDCEDKIKKQLVDGPPLPQKKKKQ